MCTKAISVQNRNKLCDKAHEVQTLPIRDRFLKHALERSDKWGDEVAKRLQNCIDLVAVEARYHKQCANRFFHENSSQKQGSGRPITVSKIEAFESLCDWLENKCDSEVYTIQELFERIKNSTELEVYSQKTFREKLKLRYNDHVYFVPRNGRHGEILCFKNMSGYILKGLKEQNKEDVIAEAAKLIKDDIRNMHSSTQFYPDNNDITADEDGSVWVPESLKIFMSHLIPSKLKRLSINQCIVHASRPRSLITPIPFGLGVSVEKSFDSKSLLNVLSCLRFCISTDEVLRFKQSAVDHQHDSNQVTNENNSLVQWVGDNVDHNLATLTGKGTFHCMRVISINSHGINHADKRIPYLKRFKSGLSSQGSIKIIPYSRPLTKKRNPAYFATLK